MELLPLGLILTILCLMIVPLSLTDAKAIDKLLSVVSRPSFYLDIDASHSKILIHKSRDQPNRHTRSHVVKVYGDRNLYSCNSVFLVVT